MGRPIDFQVTEPDDETYRTGRLKLGVSATVTDTRLQAVLGADTAIWSLCADQPHNDILRRADDQAAFRQELRRLYNRIKARHGEERDAARLSSASRLTGGRGRTRLDA